MNQTELQNRKLVSRDRFASKVDGRGSEVDFIHTWLQPGDSKNEIKAETV
jgi:hypothetical protein